MREGGLEPPSPFGHRVLKAVEQRTILGFAGRPVSALVVSCPSVSLRCEQGVSNRQWHPGHAERILGNLRVGLQGPFSSTDVASAPPCTWWG